MGYLSFTLIMNPPAHCRCEEHNEHRWDINPFIFRWLYTDIEVSLLACLIRLCADGAWVCVCARMWRPGHAWQQQMTTYPSLALGPEITMSSGLAPAGPKPGKGKSRRCSMHRRVQFIDRYEADGWNVTAFSIPRPMLKGVEGSLKVFWEIPEKYDKKNPSTSFLIVNWRDPYIFLPPCLISSLSFCLSIRMWLLVSDLYWENSKLPQEDTVLCWAVAVGGLKNERVRKKNRSDCKRLWASHPA